MKEVLKNGLKPTWLSTATSASILSGDDLGVTNVSSSLLFAEFSDDADAVAISDEESSIGVDLKRHIKEI